MNNLPTTSPAEVLAISPEALEVANCYLQTPNILETASALGVSVDTVTQILGQREVKTYIDQVFYNLGFNNRFKIRSAMDAIISKKFAEMDEADMGSSKDITELLALSHKMTMEHMAAELALEKVRSGNMKTQMNTNIQINEGGSKYSSLIERLIAGNTIVQ